MKRYLAISIVLVSGVLQAAPVTIDFEEFTLGARGALQNPGDPLNNSRILQSQGFNILYSGGAYDELGNDFCDAGGSVTLGVNGTKVLRTASGLPFPSEGYNSNCVKYGGGFSLSRTDGQAFAIYSIDVLLNFVSLSGTTTWDLAQGESVPSPVSYGFTVRLPDGQTVYQDGLEFGTDVLLNVQQLRFSYDYGQYYYSSTDYYLEIDNIALGEAVTVVPIPATTWLFLSALGLLGVRRRMGRCSGV